jgi:hypothetical protein
MPSPPGCVYAGGQFGSSLIPGPVNCFCTRPGTSDAVGICVATDAEGESECPRKDPLREPTCSSGQECLYGFGAGIANCSCSVDEAGEGYFVCDF